MVRYRSYRAGGSSRVPVPKTVGRKRKYNQGLPPKKKKKDLYKRGRGKNF